MKRIVAIIKDDRLARVLQELDRNEIYLKTISRVYGPDAPRDAPVDAWSGEESLAPWFRLEIAVNDNYVRPTIDAILNGARTGSGGAGKIFIQPLEQCIRIRNGDTGTIAIG
jgi:nitrogen regulatory protein P-II 1